MAGNTPCRALACLSRAICSLSATLAPGIPCRRVTTYLAECGADVFVLKEGLEQFEKWEEQEQVERANRTSKPVLWVYFFFFMLWVGLVQFPYYTLFHTLIGMRPRVDAVVAVVATPTQPPPGITTHTCNTCCLALRLGSGLWRSLRYDSFNRRCPPLFCEEYQCCPGQ